MKVSAAEERIAEAVIGLLLLKGKSADSYMKTRSEKTSKELGFLEDIFEISSYPDYKTKQVLSLLLDMTQKTIQIWFQNKRRCLKTAIRRQVLSEKNKFNGVRLSSERLYRKMHMGSTLLSQKSIPLLAILRTYCKAFGIAWYFS